MVEEAGNGARGGGNAQDTAARWLIKSGAKLVESDEYPYAGAMNWCRKDLPSQSLVDLSGLQQVETRLSPDNVVAVAA